MPPKPRTRLHMLAEAITSLDKATACLQEIDLRDLRSQADVREEIKQARVRAAEAMDTARKAYESAATAGLKQLA